jgi:hypothetical protein
MAIISLTLYKDRFFGSVLKSPTQMGSVSVNKLGHENLTLVHHIYRLIPCSISTHTSVCIMYGNAYLYIFPHNSRIYEKCVITS